MSFLNYIFSSRRRHTRFDCDWSSDVCSSDLCLSKDTKMWYHNGTPWIDKTEWDKTKAEYCRREGIHLHFDDTPEYEGYFTTPFARVWTKNNRNGRGIKQRRD